MLTFQCLSSHNPLSNVFFISLEGMSKCWLMTRLINRHRRKRLEQTGRKKSCVAASSGKKKSAVFFFCFFFSRHIGWDTLTVLLFLSETYSLLESEFFIRFVHSQPFSLHLLLWLVFFFLSEIESHQWEIKVDT